MSRTGFRSRPNWTIRPPIEKLRSRAVGRAVLSAVRRRLLGPEGMSLVRPADLSTASIDTVPVLHTHVASPYS